MSDNESRYDKKFSLCDFVIFGIIVFLGVMAVLSCLFFDGRIISRFSHYSFQWNKNTWLEAFRYLGKTWALIWCLLVWFWISNRLKPVLIGLLALLLLAPVVPSLKVIVGRPRPREVLATQANAENNSVRLRGHSFPSGDTASAFAVATVLAFFFRWLWVPIFFVVGIGVGFFRMTDLAHYPSDVFSGAAIGILAGWLALYIIRRWILLDTLQLPYFRTISLLGLFVTIPLVWVFKGFNHFLLFLKTYVLLAVGIYLIAQITTRSKYIRQHNRYSN
jgi:membrane-associated phospholipid phosphatase